MSDQKANAGDGMIDQHYCEHPNCKAWGGFGFSKSKAEPPRWWCWPHYPYKEPPR